MSSTVGVCAAASLGSPAGDEGSGVAGVAPAGDAAEMLDDRCGALLNRGLKLVYQMTLMTIGLYSEPNGAYLPSILY